MYKVAFNKHSRKLSSLWGFAPNPIVHRMYTLKNTYCTKFKII